MVKCLNLQLLVSLIDKELFNDVEQNMDGDDQHGHHGGEFWCLCR